MTLYVLCGMIASGKSTYARTAAGKGSIIINDDAIVNMVHGGEYTLYNKELKSLYKSTENHIAGMALALRRSVLVDRGLNLSPHGRKRWISLAHSFDVRCEAIQFPVEAPAVHAHRRCWADARGHDFAYWLNVATRHHDQFILPSTEEGLDAVHHVSFEQIQNGFAIGDHFASH